MGKGKAATAGFWSFPNYPSDHVDNLAAAAFVQGMEGTVQNRLRESAPGERPQERLLCQGPGALSDAELIAMVLRNGTQGSDVLSVAHALIREAGSLPVLLGWKADDFQRIRGVGKIKALQFVSVMELARRAMGSDGELQPVLDRPDAIVKRLRPVAAGLSVEKFWVLCLNRKNRLIKSVEVTSGIATSSLAHPREVFRDAIRVGAVAIVCAHNHPSGDPTPSAADIQVTRQLRESAKTLDIALLDHVIIGEAKHDPAGRGFYSFRESGVL